MKLVIQRVKKAKVTVEEKIVGQIGQGLLLLVGIEDRVEEQETRLQSPLARLQKTGTVGQAIANGGQGRRVEKMAEKILKLRIFADKDDKMNLSVRDIKGEILAVSQFTLLADCSDGNRPSFIKAAPPEIAKPLFEKFVQELKKSNLKVETGIFGAKMEVELVNDGPVTIILEV